MTDIESTDESVENIKILIDYLVTEKTKFLADNYRKVLPKDHAPLTESERECSKFDGKSISNLVQ